MRSLIKTSEENCVGCNKCIMGCPVEEANVAYELDGQVKVKIDNEKCIHCGECVRVCDHEAREFEDDTERFFADLQRGEKISVFIAPAGRTNFMNEDWRKVIKLLKNKGVQKVFDVSLGADICTWGHIRFIQKNDPVSVITQPCPAIVNYALRYKTELMEYMSRVHSPMLCTAIYMRKYKNIDHKIAALSPCIAKANEFEATDYVSYNVTFAKLKEYIKKNNITLPRETEEFDNIKASLGSVFSMPGGLKENVEFYLGTSVRVDKCEGVDTIYRALDEFLHEKKENLPKIFDVLNCKEGCNMGTGCGNDASIYHINKVMHDVRVKSQVDYKKTLFDKMTKLYTLFDKELNLNDFIRSYQTSKINTIHVTEREIEEAFKKLEKYTEAERTKNCYSCGSETCKEMAIKIAKGINIPENCFNRNKKMLTEERNNYRKEHKIVEESVNKTKELTRELENSSRGLLTNIDEIGGFIKNISLINSNNTKDAQEIKNELSIMKNKYNNVIEFINGIKNNIDKYSKMTETVTSVAEQTNLLALNAAIEASRAGETGKGFAVVADEIRKLAQNSQDSVSEVSQNHVAVEKSMLDIVNISKDLDQILEKVASLSNNLVEKVSQVENQGNKLKERSSTLIDSSNEIEKFVGKLENLAKF